MTCTNPNCRHPTRRKLRPLVVSLPPPPPGDGAASASSEKSADLPKGEGRRERIERMFATHPSLVGHFEPPVFSPGVPSRDLRNRLRLLEHANGAGLIPEVEWDAICRATREQNPDVAAPGGNREENIGSEMSSTSAKYRHKDIDPFRYLATTKKIEPSDEDANDDTNNKNDDNGAKKSENKAWKKNHWLKEQTTSLVPISPRRQGSAEDISLPYSMELWRKAKTLNRDRSVLACTLAHLLAMKKLVDGNENHSLDGSAGDVGFDFILEDNVRAFVGIGNAEGHPTGNAPANGTEREVEHGTWWGCECANRIWDIIEASDDSSSECHMRYYGWLGSLPNINWIYEKHVPRSAFNKTSHDSETGECEVFPFPTADDFEIDSIDATCKSNKQEGRDESRPGEGSEDRSTSRTPHFTTPGGTAVWGTFAYTISPAAHRTLVDQLQNDVGALMWKGKRMRAYQAKPIDKVLPRHVKSEFGRTSVHVPARVAFVRGPMLGSLLHPQWEVGFCNSTELQHRLSCGDKDVNSSINSNPDSSADGSNIWDHVWLTKEELQVVNHRKQTGEWVQKEGITNNNHSLRRPRSADIAKVIQLGVFIAMVSLSFVLSSECLLVPFLPRYVLVDAFAFDKLIRHGYKGSNRASLARSRSPEDDAAVEGERKRGKLGKVPIISRKIPIEIKVPRRDDSDGNDTESLDVTVWEMDKPSDLIQEWWSIDESERGARVGDPFGVVMWPGSILASKELMKRHYSSPPKSAITNATVLVLGAGTGVEAQTAALLGATKVIATDINPLTLKLLEYGAKNDARIGDSFEARFFDMFSSEPLPACDILIAADVLYNPDLANQVGRRLHEAIVRSFEEGTPPTKVIITDSQKFHGTNFLQEVAELRGLNALFEENDWEQLQWETRKLESVCTSGVLVDEDQVYDVDVRMICWGW